MNERKGMQPLFKRFIESRPEFTNGCYELKICKAKSMPFDQVKKHQIYWLKKAKHGKMYYKIADVGKGTKPFDCFSVSGVPAYIVVWYYKPRQPKQFIFIDVDVFEREVDESKRKSLTEQRAREIGKVYNITNKE